MGNYIIIIIAGIISAFVDNVATVLRVAPVALDIAKRLKISPVNSIVAIAVALNAIKEIDCFTVLLLAGLFIVIGGITKAGVVNDISKLFVKLSKDNLFVIYTLIVWASVLFSAFIDNIPYIATMLPVTASIASILNIESIYSIFRIAFRCDPRENMTPIGASANIAALEILRKDGYEVSAGQFMKIGIPFTLAAVTTGYIMIWLIWV